MIIGYRYEERGDTLRIHSVNVLLQALLLLFLLACAGVPLLLSGELAGRNGPERLLAVLAMTLLPVLGLACAWYFPLRETLELDRAGNRVQRSRRNLFGGRASCAPGVVAGAGSRLQLRRTGTRQAPVRLWLLARSGGAHQLSFDTVAVRPGHAVTEAWVQRIAAHLGLPPPGAVVDMPPLPSPGAPAQRHATLAAAPPPDGDRDRDGAVALPPGIRAVLALLGSFLAVLEATQAFALLRALCTGTLYSRAWRGGPHAYHWDERPAAFLLQSAAGLGEVLIVGMLAWGCLRLAVGGRLR